MIIADTGFWLALANRKDRHHAVAMERLREINEPLITTWPVITEASFLLLTRLGAFAQLQFFRSFLDGAFEVFEIPGASYARILALMKKYQALPMDLADASLVILAEEAGEGRILSTDARDFKAYRWKDRKPFKNILLCS